MEHKLLLGMIGGFIAFTVLAIVVVYALSADLSFNSVQSRAVNKTETANISLDPKPPQVLGKGTDKPLIPSPTPTPTAVPSSRAAASASTPQDSLTIDPASVYSLINAHRKEQRLSSLRIHSSLELSSRKKLEDMRANNYWRHENAQGVMDWSIFEQSGYHYSSAGENLSFANNSAWAVFNSWVNSPQHNEQMLKAEYEDMGLAVDCQNYLEAGKGKCAVVLHLGRQQ